MADMLHATADQIRDELRKLDARRARLRKLLAIAEEDEGKVPGPKPEAATGPAPEPATPGDETTAYDDDVAAGVRAAEEARREGTWDLDGAPISSGAMPRLEGQAKEGRGPRKAKEVRP